MDTWEINFLCYVKLSYLCHQYQHHLESKHNNKIERNTRMMRTECVCREIAHVRYVVCSCICRHHHHQHHHKLSQYCLSLYMFSIRLTLDSSRLHLWSTCVVVLKQYQTLFFLAIIMIIKVVLFNEKIIIKWPFLFVLSDVSRTNNNRRPVVVKCLINPRLQTHVMEKCK